MRVLEDARAFEVVPGSDDWIEEVYSSLEVDLESYHQASLDQGFSYLDSCWDQQGHPSSVQVYHS